MLHLVGEISARRRGWQGSPFLTVKIDGVVDDSAQLVEHASLIVSVTASIDQAWRTADIAVILVGPFNNLYVASAILHFFASSMAS
jgi:hypothetical protein